MKENKYNLDNSKNCISDGNNTLIITHDKDSALHPREAQDNLCHLIPLTGRLKEILDDIDSIADALKKLIADAHLNIETLGITEYDIEHKPKWSFDKILKEYNKCLKEGNIKNSIFNHLAIQPLWLYEHGGMSLNTYRQDRWDSSFVGIAYTTTDEVQKWMMDKDNYNKHEDLEVIFEKNLQWELDSLNQYINGEVYASYFYQKTQDEFGNISDELMEEEHDLYYPDFNSVKEMYLNSFYGKTFDMDNIQEFDETMDIDEFDINAFKNENYGQNKVEIYRDHARQYASIEQKDFLGNVYTAIVQSERPDALTVFRGNDVSEFTLENMVLSKNKSELNNTLLDLYNKLNDSLSSQLEQLPYYKAQKAKEEVPPKLIEATCENINYKNLGNTTRTYKNKEEKEK